MSSPPSSLHLDFSPNRVRRHLSQLGFTDVSDNILSEFIDKLKEKARREEEKMKENQDKSTRQSPPRPTHQQQQNQNHHQQQYVPTQPNFDTYSYPSQSSSHLPPHHISSSSPPLSSHLSSSSSQVNHQNPPNHNPPPHVPIHMDMDHEDERLYREARTTNTHYQVPNSQNNNNQNTHHRSDVSQLRIKNPNSLSTKSQNTKSLKSTQRPSSAHPSSTLSSISAEVDLAYHQQLAEIRRLNDLYDESARQSTKSKEIHKKDKIPLPSSSSPSRPQSSSLSSSSSPLSTHDVPPPAGLASLQRESEEVRRGIEKVLRERGIEVKREKERGNGRGSYNNNRSSDFHDGSENDGDDVENKYSSRPYSAPFSSPQSLRKTKSFSSNNNNVNKSNNYDNHNEYSYRHSTHRPSSSSSSFSPLNTSRSSIYIPPTHIPLSSPSPLSTSRRFGSGGFRKCDPVSRFNEYKKEWGTSRFLAAHRNKGWQWMGKARE